MSVSNEFFYNNTTLAGEAIFFDPIKIGCGAGNISQGENSVALGTGAGYINQGTRSVAIGSAAGGAVQSDNAIAIGQSAGYALQGVNAIAIGNLAGSGIFAQALTGTIINNILITPAPSDIFCVGMQLYINGAEIGSAVIARLSNDSNGSARYSVTSTDDVTVPMAIVGIGSGQNTNSVAIGNNAAVTSQGIDSIAIGNTTGYLNQADYAVAIGYSAAQHGQGVKSIAIGYNAATGQASETSSGTIVNNIFTADSPTAEFAVGMNLYTDLIDLGTTVVDRLSNDLSGRHRYSVTTVADIASPVSIVGRTGTQQLDAISIGSNSGQRFQHTNAISIGTSSGKISQGTASIALGTLAGEYNQGDNSIAIGNLAGTGQIADTMFGTIIDNVFTAVSPSAVFVSGMKLYSSNNTYLGTSVISRLTDLNGNHRYLVTAIPDITIPKYISGVIGQSNNTIIINASGLPLDGITAQPGSTYVSPIRSSSATESALFYNTTTNEVTTGFPCLPSYAGDAAANAAIAALGATLTDGMMYIDITTVGGHALKLYLNGAWVTK